MEQAQTGDPIAELSLRDILETLKRQIATVLSMSLLTTGIAFVYGFFLAEPLYASKATVSVAPAQVQAQLESRIQVEEQIPLTFEGLKALALSERVTREVWETLRKEGKLPTRWQDQGSIPGLERMLRDFKIKDLSPKTLSPTPNQRPLVVASLEVTAPSPEVAALAANLWAEGVVRQANEIPLARLRAGMRALEEQLGPAEKAFLEAQARLEAFRKTTTLPQDQAELEAKTREQVELDQERAGVLRDLASVRGKIQGLTAEVQRQQAILPLNIDPTEIPLINRALREAKNRLQVETSRAQQAYLEAAKALEAFRGQEKIPLWQAEISAYTEGYAIAQGRLVALEKDLNLKRAQLQEAEARLAEYKAQLPGLSLENLVAGLPVTEAQALVETRLKEAEARLQEAEKAWEAFQRTSNLEALKRELGGVTERLANIRLRLERLATDRALLETRLGQAEAELAKEPKLIVLEREIAADPAALALAAQGNVEALLGLKLKNQELNPVHTKLLTAVLDLKADLAALEREEKSLKEEASRLEPKVQAYQGEVARLEAEKARLSTQLEVARETYNSVYRYAETFKRIAAGPGLTLREVNPDVLAYRDKAVNLRAEIVALEAEKGALTRNLRTYEERIRNLRSQIAAQERAKEAILLAYGAKKAAYEAFRNRYDRVQNLTGDGLTFDNPNPEYQRLRSALLDALVEEGRLEARLAALESRLGQVASRIGILKERVARAQAEQDRLSQELELKKSAYVALAQKRTDLGIQIASSQESLAQILAPAYPIYEKVAPKQALLLAVALVLGLALGVMGAFLLEALNPRPEDRRFQGAG